MRGEHGEGSGITTKLRAATFGFVAIVARHWIAAIPPLLILAAWLTGALDAASAGIRAGFLALTCILLPIAYHLSIRAGLKGQATLVRSLGLALSAVSLNGWLLFDRSEPVFRLFAYEQWLLLALVLVIEIRITGMILSSVFRMGADSSVIAERVGLPRFLVRLMILEARFWKAVYRFFGRPFLGRSGRGEDS